VPRRPAAVGCCTKASGRRAMHPRCLRVHRARFLLHVPVLPPLPCARPRAARRAAHLGVVRVIPRTCDSATSASSTPPPRRAAGA